MSAPSPADQLAALADHLEPSLARRHLRQLVTADSEAHRYLEVSQRAQRAEDVLAELRLQYRGLERTLERARLERS